MQKNLHILLASCENELLERKEKICSPFKMAKSIDLLAKFKAGRLWLGIDDNGKIVAHLPHADDTLILMLPGFRPYRMLKCACY